MRTATAAQIEPTGNRGTRVRIRTTLLDLVRAVSESTEDDAEVVRTILHMLRSGSVELCGSFKDEPVEDF